MSFYNMLCSTNPAAGRLLAAINLKADDVPRIRDVFVNPEMTEVTVHTRTGGGNREAYEAENDALCAHPLYLRDSDDDFDSTYADFVFRLPEEEKAKLLAEIDDMVANEENREDVRGSVLDAITATPRAKFDAVMERIGATPPKDESK